MRSKKGIIALPGCLLFLFTVKSFINFSHKYEEVEAIKDYLLSKTQVRPSIGIICGSGLGGLVDNVENKEEFKYEDIPGFPLSTGKQIFKT